jgi:hypothetical protein
LKNVALNDRVLHLRPFEKAAAIIPLVRGLDASRFRSPAGKNIARRAVKKFERWMPAIRFPVF